MKLMQTSLLATAAGALIFGSAALAEPGGNGGGKGNDKGNGRGNGAAEAGPDRGNSGGGPARPQGGEADDARKMAQGGPPDKKEPSPASRQSQPEPPRGADVAKSDDDRGPDKPGRDERSPGKPRTLANAPGNAKKHTPPPARKTDSGTRWISDLQNDRPKPAAPARKPRTDIKRVTYSVAGGRQVVVPSNDRVRIVMRERAVSWPELRRTSYDGCPPGLAKKYNGCTPPGLDRTPDRAWARPTWYFSDYDRDYRYRYSDGYMLRMGSGSSILSYIPLLAGALSIGQPWPGQYQSVALPPYYDDYYGLGAADSYRYYDDTIYRVDPGNSSISSVAALLTGNDIVMGQPMPVGYEVYNVPYAYRDQYYDGPDAMYRYSDGYIYQLDPTTRLVQAAIELLA